MILNDIDPQSNKSLLKILMVQQQASDIHLCVVVVTRIINVLRCSINCSVDKNLHTPILMYNDIHDRY